MNPARNQKQNRKTKRKMKMKMPGLGTETKEKEKIIVQGLGKDVEKRCLRSEFYEIDMAKGCVKEIPHLLYQCMNSITAIGSVVYMVGGVPSDMMDKETNPRVYRTYMFSLDSNSDSDSNSGEGGWKEIPPYIPPASAYVPGCRIPEIPFCHPTAVSLGGKIYVFAGHTKTPSAVVFNSNTNKWETLLPPPHVGFFDVTSPASAVADPDNNRLLVQFKTISSIYAYYPSDNTWEFIVHSFGGSKFVFADGLFYIYLGKHPDLVMAFDAVTKQFLKIEFTSEPPRKMWIYEYADMLYLGNGLMCLVDYYSTQPPRIDVSVAKFRFKRCTDRPAVLIITPLPLETYELNTFSSLLNYYPL